MCVFNGVGVLVLEVLVNGIVSNKLVGLVVFVYHAPPLYVLGVGWAGHDLADGGGQGLVVGM